MARDSLSPAERKASRRILWWLLGICVVVPVLLLFWLMYFYDIDPPEDRDFQPVLTPQGTGPNPLKVFSDTWHNDLETFAAEFNALGAVKDEPSQHLYELDDLLGRHQPLLAALEQLVLTPRPILWPEADRPVRTFPKGYSTCNDLISAAKIGRLAVIRDAGRGHVDPAITRWAGMLHFAKDLLNHGEGTTIQTATATNIVSLTASLPQAIQRAAPLTEAHLLAMETELRNVRISPSAFHVASQIDYQRIDWLVADCRRTPFGASYGGLIDGWAARTAKLNLSKAEFIARYRPLLAISDWVTMEATTRDLGNEIYTYRQSAKSILSSNVAGNFVVHTTLQTNLALLNHAMRTSIRRDFVRLQLALRRFELATGHLPEHLSELCPQYLPSVPIDPYDGASLRWNKTKGALYSIGSDRADDGGDVTDSEGREFRSRGDYGCIYWWKPKPPEPAASPAKSSPSARKKARMPPPRR